MRRRRASSQGQGLLVLHTEYKKDRRGGWEGKRSRDKQICITTDTPAGKQKDGDGETDRLKVRRQNLDKEP